MFRQIVSQVTLVAFVAYTLSTSGCTRVVSRSGEELRKSLSKPARVTGLTLKTGESVEFDSAGATYRPYAKFFSGVTDDGTPSQVPLNRVDSVHYLRDVQCELGVATARKFDGIYNNQRDRLRRACEDVGNLRDLFVADSTVFIKRRTARFDFSQRAIMGISDSNTIVSVPILDVDSLRTTENFGNRTIIFFSVAAIFTAFVIIVGKSSREGSAFPPGTSF